MCRKNVHETFYLYKLHPLAFYSQFLKEFRVCFISIFNSLPSFLFVFISFYWLDFFLFTVPLYMRTKTDVYVSIQRNMLFFGWKSKILKSFFNHLMCIHDTSSSHVKVNFLYSIMVCDSHVLRGWGLQLYLKKRLMHFCLYLFRFAIISTFLLELFTSWYVHSNWIHDFEA